MLSWIAVWLLSISSPMFYLQINHETTKGGSRLGSVNMMWNVRCQGHRKDGAPCNANATILGRDGVAYCYHHQNQGLTPIIPTQTETKRSGNVHAAPPKAGTSCPDCNSLSVSRTSSGRIRCDVCRNEWR